MHRSLRSSSRFTATALAIVIALATAGCGKKSSDGPVGERPSDEPPASPPEEPAIHVQPGESIQDALEKAAGEGLKRIIVHAGTYRPPAHRQALIWFNERHDGISLEADGEVVLTAANPEVAEQRAVGFPAIVNHVVYFGHRVGPETTLRGFKITGANGFVTTDEPEIQPGLDDPVLQSLLGRGRFFYSDGGGIKIYGKSSPTIEDCEIYDNYSNPCGAGISIEQRGFNDSPVTIRNCIFRDNRAPVTGVAIDLLDWDSAKGSSAVIENCLFIGNLGNGEQDERSVRGSWSKKMGHGAITVFPPSKVMVARSTFVGNRNGVDDLGKSSSYTDCIFWHNSAPGGWPTGERYEFDIRNGAGVVGCAIAGTVADVRGKIDPAKNLLDPPDPQFDAAYTPQAEVYRDIGYRGAGVVEDQP